jgi:hypothetical protein
MMKRNDLIPLALPIEPSQLVSFYPLLQEGVLIKTWVGWSIQTFLEKGLDMSPEFIKDKVKTVFLDGKAVDDLTAARIRDGSVLSLSGALPGLVGATLRAGGFFAGLRSQITYREENSPVLEQEGMITVKVFNLLLKELAPLILKKGVWVRKKDLAEDQNGGKALLPGPSGPTGSL